MNRKERVEMGMSNETGLLYDQIKQPIEYDHYIICFDNTFHANDLKIAKKLFETGRKFYLVRTQMDLAISKEETNLGRELSEEDEENLFREIRQNANASLISNELR